MTGQSVVMHTWLAHLALDTDLTGRTWRVLATLLGSMSDDCEICVAQSEIAKTLDLDPANVSREIKLLVAKHILNKSRKIGRIQTYTFTSKDTI